MGAFVFRVPNVGLRNFGNSNIHMKEMHIWRVIERGYHFIALEEGERVVEVESSLFYRKKTQSKMRTELRILFSPGMYLFIVLD